MPYDTFPSQEGKPMFPEEITFFEKMPSMLSVYQALRDQLVKRCPTPVSYTHLTLPTILRV